MGKIEEERSLGQYSGFLLNEDDIANEYWETTQNHNGKLGYNLL